MRIGIGFPKHLQHQSSGQGVRDGRETYDGESDVPVSEAHCGRVSGENSGHRGRLTAPNTICIYPVIPQSEQLSQMKGTWRTSAQ